jgi:predicted nucleic acid-binding protein
VAAFYLDSSALVKRYIVERGTLWIRSLTVRHAAHVLFTARVTGPEVVAAIARKVHVGDMLPHDAARAANNFRRDWRIQYQIVEISSDLADRAMDLAQKHVLRGYDAMHLAAALELRQRRQVRTAAGLTFLSADVGQLQAAGAEGLSVQDPNAQL